MTPFSHNINRQYCSLLNNWSVYVTFYKVSPCLLLFDVSIVEYHRCKSCVTKARQSPNPTEKIIATKMHQLLDALSQLNILHTIWVVKAGFTEEELQAEKYSINWLESEWGDLQAEPLQYSSHHSHRSWFHRQSPMSHWNSEIRVMKLTQLLQQTISTPESPFSCSPSRLSAYKEILDNVTLDL